MTDRKSIGNMTITKEFDASASAAGGENLPGAKSTPNSIIRVTDLIGHLNGDAEKIYPAKRNSIVFGR